MSSNKLTLLYYFRQRTTCLKNLKYQKNQRNQKNKGKQEKVGLKEEPKPTELTRKQQVAINIIEEWEAKLKKADYYSYYFSRAESAKGAICDEKGSFE